MTPEFSAVVDKVFEYVLKLLERIGNGEEPSPQDERTRILTQLSQAEAKLGRSPDWLLAKYALVAWIDEMLIIEAPWQSGEAWNESALEWETFHSNIRFREFYEEAKRAFDLPKKDALEVFYVCVVLGFRGLYRDPAAAAVEAGALNLPLTLKQWTDQMADAIRLRLGRPQISVDNKPLEGAPPLPGPEMLVWGSLFGLALAVLVVIVYWLAI